MPAVQQWISEINPVIAAHQISNGGDVIAYQIENADLPSESTQIQQAYMAALEALARGCTSTGDVTGLRQVQREGGAVPADARGDAPARPAVGQGDRLPALVGVTAPVPEVNAGDLNVNRTVMPSIGGPGPARARRLTGRSFSSTAG